MRRSVAPRPRRQETRGRPPPRHGRGADGWHAPAVVEGPSGGPVVRRRPPPPTLVAPHRALRCAPNGRPRRLRTRPVDTGIGQTLRDAREARGRSLEDVARVLRLRTDQLRALEEERFDSFGGDVYARGFLKSYALELGLDPQPLLDIHRREVADEDTRATTLVGAGAATTPPRRSAPPAWMAWVLVTVVVLAGLGIVGALGGGRAPEVAGDAPRESPPPPADPDADADADAGDGTGEGEDDDGQTPPDDDGDDGEEPEVTEPEGVELLLALEDRSWMRVTVDGTVVFEQIAEQGELLRYDGEEEISIRFGDAGVVRVEVNGEDLGVPGGRGQVADVTYTPDGPADDV
ncbi:helix-turn-helix domain-containing protein [Nitriliruptoraceae bacterium ZYF776]|nr:helix-turn-helix domain-containing protein [Profundirhabdus halotolerans]